MPEKLLKKNEIDGLLKKPGKHRDGAGLYLQIARRGQASWVYQFRWNAETKWMSIGPAATFKLEEARKRHHELRRMRDRGIDPRSSVAAVALQPYQPSPSMAPAAPDAPEPPEQPASPLFGEVVELFLNDFAADWAGGFEGKEAKSYRRTLITKSSLAKFAVAEIKTEHVEAELVAAKTALAPGEPLTIAGRLIADGGWIEREGVTAFNLYRPPTIRPARTRRRRWQWGLGWRRR